VGAWTVQEWTDNGGVLVDSDGVMWLIFGDIGPAYAGDLLRGIMWEWVDTGSSARVSQALWDVNAPRIVRDATGYRLAGFGESELADGVSNSRALAQTWVNGPRLTLARVGTEAMGAHSIHEILPFDG
jgi:hypothetical protein